MWRHCRVLEGKAACTCAGVCKGKHLEYGQDWVLFRALPEKGFGMKGSQCKRGKSKQRVTVAFFVNAASGKDLPIVIQKSENPRCFKVAVYRQRTYFNVLQ